MKPLLLVDPLSIIVPLLCLVIYALIGFFANWCFNFDSYDKDITVMDVLFWPIRVTWIIIKKFKTLFR